MCPWIAFGETATGRAYHVEKTVPIVRSMHRCTYEIFPTAIPVLHSSRVDYQRSMREGSTRFSREMGRSNGGVASDGGADYR